MAQMLPKHKVEAPSVEDQVLLGGPVEAVERRPCVHVGPGDVIAGPRGKVQEGRIEQVEARRQGGRIGHLAGDLRRAALLAATPFSLLRHQVKDALLVRCLL